MQKIKHSFPCDFMTSIVRQRVEPEMQGKGEEEDVNIQITPLNHRWTRSVV